MAKSAKTTFFSVARMNVPPFGTPAKVGNGRSLFNQSRQSRICAVHINDHYVEIQSVLFLLLIQNCLYRIGVHSLVPFNSIEIVFVNGICQWVLDGIVGSPCIASVSKVRILKTVDCFVVIPSIAHQRR